MRLRYVAKVTGDFAVVRKGKSLKCVEDGQNFRSVLESHGKNFVKKQQKIQRYELLLKGDTFRNCFIRR